MSDLIERARKSKSLLVPKLKEELIDRIEQLQDKVNQWERWWFECDASDDPPYQPDYPVPPEEDTCKHNWVSGDNEHVTGCQICLECKMIRAASPEEEVHWSPGDEI